MRSIALLLLLSLVLGGCAAAGTGVETPVDTLEVLMPPSYRFDPVAIRVPVGATVTWRNTDNFSHSVQVQTGDFPTLNLAPGESGTLTFAQPGTYDYLCTYHAQDMQGTVMVVER